MVYMKFHIVPCWIFTDLILLHIKNSFHIVVLFIDNPYKYPGYRL